MLKNLTKTLTSLVKNTKKTFMKQPKAFRMLFVVGLIVIVLHKTNVVNLSALQIPGLSRNLEGFQGNGNKTFLFIHMKGCGHCETLMPVWDEFSQENKGSVETKKIESNEGGSGGIGPKSVEKYSVQGFPFLAMVDGQGEIIEEYSGDRTKNSLHEFVQKHA